MSFFDKYNPLKLAAKLRQAQDENTKLRRHVAWRNYNSAQTTRLTAGWVAGDRKSGDSELIYDLRNLRGRSRDMVRNNAYAKRARNLVVNNIVGTGIKLQAAVKFGNGKLDKRINDDVETVFDRWSRGEFCHTGGQLDFSDLERLAIAQVFETGEVIIRQHFSPFGDSGIPYALELIESERLAEEYETKGTDPRNVRMGVETDEYHRPIAYYLHRTHPGDMSYTLNTSSAMLERVPAEQIIHLRLIERWPQTRGIPWMHSCLKRLWDIDGYGEAEIIAARAASSYMGFVTSPESPGADIVEGDQQQLNFEPGIMRHLLPGESIVFNDPKRPNAAFESFMRFMLREIATATGVSYESLSRDYSQSNYSSSRLALLDDRDVWRIVQQWFIRNFRARVHRTFIRQAALARAFEFLTPTMYANDMERYEAAAFKPRGWSWIDPTKEVEAYASAVRNGFMTVGEVIGLTSTGNDLEGVMDERENELEMMEEKGLTFDTSPQQIAEENPGQNIDKPEKGDETNEDETENNVVPMKAGQK